MSAAELFAGAGSRPGVEAWRIEKMKPVKQPPGFELGGKFHIGDSYIVLHTFELKGAVAYNAHFWIGDESTRDEAGAAALLTVELDQFLGDVPTQFRETQARESREFLQLFPNGVRYLEGGVDSAFVHVDRDAYEPRLLHVKGGRKNVRVVNVPMSVASLNSGDAFILDTGKTLTQWNGAGASRAEKAKALDVVLQIKSEEHGGKSTVLALEELGGADQDGLKEFFAALGCDDVASARIKTAEEGGSDDVVLGGAETRLFHLSDEADAGTLRMTEVTEVPLKREALKTEDVFVLVAGGVVYAWVGKKASPGEKKAANEFLAAGERARKFLVANDLDVNTPVKLVKEWAEPPLFKQAFHRWIDADASREPGGKAAAAPRARAEVDVAAMAGSGARDSEAAANAASNAVPLGGKLDVFRVENFELEPVKEQSHGQFYAGDSYVLKYSYDDDKKHVVYFWQGRDSTADEKGASALLAKSIDDEQCGGRATQVRVTMGKEPEHFYRLFEGRMIVRTGGRAGGFKNADEKDSYDEDGTCLYHVRGHTRHDTRAVQVADDSACLNSGDCFILTLEAKATKDGEPKVAVWEGSGASDDEKACAANVAALLAPGVGVGSSRVERIAEGREPDWFWANIGGKKPYAEFAPEGMPPQDPRLFHVSDAPAGGAGVLADEVFNFCQDDLEDDDVMLLDVVSEVFVWIGSQANENEKREAYELAQKYVKTMALTDGRDPDAPVTRVNAGEEPAHFACHFIGWDHHAGKKAFVDPYEMKLKRAKAANPTVLEMPTLKKTPERRPPGPSASASGDSASNAAAGGTGGGPGARDENGKNESSRREDGGSLGGGSLPDAKRAGDPSVSAAASGIAAVTIAVGAKTIPYEELKGLDASAGIEMERKEAYLSDADFERVFGMGKDAFGALAAWKRKDVKKKVGLF